METINAASNDRPSEMAVLNTMAAELKNIRARHQWVIKRSAEISAHIEIFERRHEYVEAALEESQRIAEEIGHNAERRVYAVMANTQRVVEPQQTKIMELELRIAELKKELEAEPAGDPGRLTTYTGAPELDYPGIELSNPEYSCESESYDNLTPAVSPLGKICSLELSEVPEPDDYVWPQQDMYPQPGSEEYCLNLTQVDTGPEANLKVPPVEGHQINAVNQTLSIDPESITSEQMEFYINQAANLDLDRHEQICPASMADLSGSEPAEMAGPANAGEYEVKNIDDNPQPNPKRQFSLREPEDELTYEYQPKNNELTEPVETYLQTALKREFSQRDPQAGPEIEQPNDITETVYIPPMSVIGGVGPYCEALSRSGHSIPQQLIEERKGSTIMHLDVFIDTRHQHNAEVRNGAVHNHRWQVKVQVEVPENKSQDVGYSQVLAAVTATLLRFDGILLNDVFPFDHIEPSHDNIAAYFFNCLEDTVMIKELRLIEVGLWEKQNLVMQIHARNKEYDELLKGEDVLQRMKGNTFHESSGGMDTSFKKMLGMMFKGKN